MGRPPPQCGSQALTAGAVRYLVCHISMMSLEIFLCSPEQRNSALRARICSSYSGGNRVGRQEWGF